MAFEKVPCQRKEDRRKVCPSVERSAVSVRRTAGQVQSMQPITAINHPRAFGLRESEGLKSARSPRQGFINAPNRCARAAKAGLVEVVFHDLHDFSEKKHKQVDDYPFGGGAGMVMAVEPLSKCIEFLKSERLYDEIIYFSPDGIVLKQGLVNQLSLGENLLFICGHYKGIDERIRR